MDEFIHVLEETFSFRIVADFRELSRSVITDPYALPRPKQMAALIGIQKTRHKTVLNFKYELKALSFYRDHVTYMVISAQIQSLFALGQDLEARMYLQRFPNR